MVSLLVLGLYYYWFGVADRYAIFLYGHLGATPFDEMTTGRYWMAGLVAAGAVLVLYASINGMLGVLARRYKRAFSPPPWWQVWLLCVIPLAVDIPAITMHVNRPVLPPSLALRCTLAALAGLVLALLPGELAARDPRGLAALGVWGLGLTPALLLLRSLELPARGLVSPIQAYAVAFGGVLAGTFWLMVGASWQARSGARRIGASQLFTSGLTLSYLVMPLVHHLLFVPAQYRYISTSSNFFAFSPGLQAVSLGVAALQALAFAWLQKRWA